jgi:hypothetical protein
VFVLSSLGLPVPSYRKAENLIKDLDPKAVQDWSHDQVCEWVGHKCFKVYRHLFRDSFVSGRILLTLTDEDLSAIGVSHPLHRRSISFAICDLKEAALRSTTTTSTDLTVSDKRSMLMRQPSFQSSAPKYDVFLSYRRKGGQDFALLIKLYLSAMGLQVFFDIDNIGTGNFDAKLASSIEESTNVIFVWTKSCMDRFMDDNDITKEDFVRKEYKMALMLKKNIIPVYKEDFEFPKVERLPEDMKPILLLNAVRFVSEYREATMEAIRKMLV